MLGLARAGLAPEGCEQASNQAGCERGQFVKQSIEKRACAQMDQLQPGVEKARLNPEPEPKKQKCHRCGIWLSPERMGQRLVKSQLVIYSRCPPCREKHAKQGAEAYKKRKQREEALEELDTLGSTKKCGRCCKELPVDQFELKPGGSESTPEERFVNCIVCRPKDNERSNAAYAAKRQKMEFQCDHEGCGKRFAVKGGLDRHMLVHSGVKDFKCEYEGCGKRFAEKCALDRHMLVHTGEKPFVCDHDGCGRTFSQSSSLIVHKRTHTGEKNFVCDHEGCGKAFARKDALDQHILVHSGEKPYVCDHEGCGKAFAQKGNLDRHMRVHSGEKNFVCGHEGCGKAFAHSSSLIDHKRTHTGDKPFVCDHEGCGKAFAQRQSLTEHKRVNHEGQLAHPCKATSETNGQCPYGLSGMQKYDRLCARCFVSAFPLDIRSIKAKAYIHCKELTVREFLDTQFPQYHWTFDRTCAVGELVRPDARTAVSKTRLLIVEIDEHSHDTYVCDNERERERIFKKHAPRNSVVHVVRFNPDAYDDPVTGNRIPSCFTYSKELGMASVPANRKADWDARLEKLRKTIQEIIDHQHEDIQVPDLVLDDDRYKYVIPVELFYDNVREKWPTGDKQRKAAYKRNAKVGRALADERVSGASSSANQIAAEESDWSDEEDLNEEPPLNPIFQPMDMNVCGDASESD